MELILEFVNALLTVFVSNKLEWLGSHESYLGASLFSVFFFWASRQVLRRLQENKFVDWRFATEGVWMQDIECHGGKKGNCISVIEISFNKKAERFEIVGRTFNQDLSLYSSWESSFVESTHNKVFHYFYRGKVHKDSRHDVFGAGRIAFFPEPTRNFQLLLAEGSFHDRTTENQDVSYQMRRATRAEIAEVFRPSTRARRASGAETSKPDEAGEARTAAGEALPGQSSDADGRATLVKP